MKTYSKCVLFNANTAIKIPKTKFKIIFFDFKVFLIHEIFPENFDRKTNLFRSI